MPTDQPSSRRADALRFLAAGAPVAAALAVFGIVLATQQNSPYGAEPVFVDEPSGRPAADPADLAREVGPARPVMRIGFVGDILQHGDPSQIDFRASYRHIKPLIEGFDLSVANLVFPVDPARPVAPLAGAARLNGSPDHLDALADAGIDILNTSNDHAFDQGLEGAMATLGALAGRGLTAVGTGDTGATDTLAVIETGGARVAIAAYTIPPISHPDDRGGIDYWSRDWPIHALNFSDWTAEYRAEGLALFETHIRRSEAEFADLRIALVHWGEAGHFQPSPDQRLAAHDMIDAGFDLVVGGHGLVLNPPELYRGRLIAYSLGNLVSDFAELEARTGAILEVTVGTTSSGQLEIVGFSYYPVLTAREDHAVRPLGTDPTGDEIEAWALARRIVGPAATAFDGTAKRISAWRGSSAEPETGVNGVIE